MHIQTFWVLLIFTFEAACNNRTETGIHQENKKDSAISREDLVADTTILVKGSVDKEDTSGNDFFQDALKSVKANFRRINSITSWTFIAIKDIDISEGGEVKL